MSESSKNQVNDRAIVIQRAGELQEFVDLLETLEVPSAIYGGELPTPDQVAGAAVVVVPGRRLMEAGSPNLSLWPRTIAVVDDSSKTMVAHLNRLGAALVVRRPIHPRTLRLLLLHEIYRGPERRRKKRILIGHPVRVGAGLFKHRATLLELSPGGARIELPSTPKIGSKLRILVGKELTLGKPRKLEAKVVRCIRPSGEKGRSEAEIGVALLKPEREAKTIRSILDRFASGPAAWEGKIAAPGDPGETASEDSREKMHSEAAEPVVEELDPSESQRRLPPSHSQTLQPDVSATAVSTREDARDKRVAIALPPPEVDTDVEPVVEEAAVVAEEATESGDGERRQDPRIPYEHRVVALDEEAARVLVGRDLSHGGMRIAANDTVGVGDMLRIALHCGTELEPLVVMATAKRDDGDDGLVLEFQNLSEGQNVHLEKIIASSAPIHAIPEDADPNEMTGSIVLGEMLETVEKGPVETEDEIEAHLDSLFDTDEAV